MSAVSSILNAPIVSRSVDERWLLSRIYIEYNGHLYSGFAHCASEDKDFFSRKVGQTIALYRAQIKALKYESKKVKEEVDWKRRIYREVTRDKDIEIPELLKNCQRAEKRYNDLIKALEIEKNNLKTYLKSQDKAIKAVRRFREQKGRK